MKPVVAFIVTFVVGIGAAAGARVMLAPAVVHADKAAGDSTKAGGGPTDTAVVAGATAGPQSDSARAVAAAAETPVPAQPAQPVPPVPTGGPVAVPMVAAPNVAPGGSPVVATAGVKQAGAPTAAPATVTPATAAKTASDTSSERRLAKVFTSMEPKQAAKVLDHMTDGDVQIILGYVGPKQAALIMSSMAPERVATLSKLALQNRR